MTANHSLPVLLLVPPMLKCCNGFLLGADGRQEYTATHNGSFGNNTWGQAPYVSAGKSMIINIDPATSTTVSAADVCATTLARKEAYANELIAIATHTKKSKDSRWTGKTPLGMMFGVSSSYGDM
jgi:hypothetical protein